MSKNERIAFFSPDEPNNPVQTYFIENIKKNIEENFIVDHFSFNNSENVFPVDEYSWRNLKNPYDLTIYNFGSGEEFNYMLPFIIIHPGLLILNRRSITHELWRIHLLDHSEENFTEEMIYNHGTKGEMLAQLVWRGLWGKPLDFQFPSMRLLIEASLLTTSTDPWILENVDKENSQSKLKLMEIVLVASEDKISEQDSLNVLIWVESTNLPQLNDIIPALKTVANKKRLKFTIICNRKITEESIKNANDKNIEIVNTCEKEKYVETLKKSDILILIDSPSDPVHSQIIFDAIANGTIPILTDSYARKYFPDEIFPKINIRQMTSELVSTIEKLGQDKDKLSKRINSIKSWMREFYTETNSESLTNMIKTALERKKEWHYPSDYPAHLMSYNAILKNQIEKKLEEFNIDGEIEKTINYLIR